MERLRLPGESSFLGVGSIFAIVECLVGDNTVEYRLRLRGESSFFAGSIFEPGVIADGFVGDNTIDCRLGLREESSLGLIFGQEAGDNTVGCRLPGLS